MQLPVWMQQSHHHLPNHVTFEFFFSLLLVTSHSAFSNFMLKSDLMHVVIAVPGTYVRSDAIWSSSIWTSSPQIASDRGSQSSRDVVVVCVVVAGGTHSYMDLSAQRHLEHVMRPPVSSHRWTPAAHCCSHVNVSGNICLVFVFRWFDVIKGIWYVNSFAPAFSKSSYFWRPVGDVPVLASQGSRLTKGCATLPKVSRSL